jgi:hypothetical protein
MMDKKMLGWGLVAIVTVLAVTFLGVRLPVPPPPQEPVTDVIGELESRSLSRPVQLRDVRILQNLDVDGDATVGGDATVSDDLTVTDDLAAGGDVTITGGLEVTGGVTGTNVLTTGNQTVGGVKTFTSAVTGTGGATITGATVNLNASSNFATNINTGTTNAALTLGGGSGTVAVNSSDWDISTAGVMTGIGAVTTDGLATLALGATISGATTAINESSNFATNINTGTSNGALTLGGGSGTVAINSSDWDISTSGAMTGIGAITADGAISGLVPVLVKGASYPVTTADTGAVIKASGAITLTLPGAAAGLHYCIVNFTGDDQVIAFTDATDVALNEVNSPGDRVTNTTVYDNICLTAIDTTNWVTLSSVGTWADGD